MRTSLYLKSQTELLADIEARMTDTGNVLATEPQYYAALSEGIRMWEGRVATPRLYAIPGGFASGTFEYTLPGYIRPPFIVQIQTSTFGYLGVVLVEEDENFTWDTLVGWSVEPKADGTWLLRLPSSPYSQSGRIIWFADNGPLPATIPTLADGLTATSTSATIAVSGGPDLSESGMVKIDTQEWVAYSGITRTSTTEYILNNLVRGLYGTEAAVHDVGDVVHWGVAADNSKLWVQLYDYVAAYVHALQLHKSTTEDTSRHEKLMSYYTTKAENFWRNEGYVSQRKGRRVLSAGALGSLVW
jgi:hypothetical protein